jgi:hypothetical protein
MEADENPREAAEIVEGLTDGDRVHLTFRRKIPTEEGYEVGEDVEIDDTATVVPRENMPILQFDDTLLQTSKGEESEYGKLVSSTPPELRLYHDGAEYPHSMVGIAILDSIELLE